MGTTRLAAALRRLRRTAGGGDGVPDAELLARYARQGDEAAFELLLYRHGPMVLAACRRVLRHTADAEDAFQATFLALVRRAGSIRRGEALAGWLFRVARRVALRLRASAPPAESAAAEPAAGGPGPEADRRDLGAVVDEEIQRLPAKYRVAVLLCYLGGRTHAEAARELGCPRGTVAVRLSRARQLLRKRLTRRGIAPAVGALAVVSTGGLRAAPAELLRRTLAAVSSFRAGATAAGVVPVRAAGLANGALREMTMSKLKAVTAALALSCGVMATAAGVVGGLTPAAELPDGRTQDRAKPPAAPADDSAPLVDVVSERDGRLTAVGVEVFPTAEERNRLAELELTEVKFAFLVVEIGRRDTVPENQQLHFFGDMRAYRRWQRGEPLPGGKVRVASESRYFRPVRVGDRLQAAQVVAIVNPAIPIDDLNVKITALTAAEADRLAAIETKLEAERRYLRDQALFNAKGGGARVVTRDEVEQSRLTWSRYVQEENAKAAGVAKAQIEINSALTILGLCEVRVATSGVVRKIHKRTGEGVRNLDPILQLQVVERRAGPATHELRSPFRGTVRAVRKRPGDPVALGEVLVEVAPDRPD